MSGRDVVGILVGLAGLGVVVLGAFAIHPGLGWMLVGIGSVGLGKAIIEA